MRLPTANRHSLRPGRTVLAVLLGALLACGCVYRIDVQQGNFLDPEKVSQLTPGMTRSQVRYLLGTPLASTPFGNARWDYVYYLRRGHSSEVQERKVTVHFEDDKVVRIEHSGADTRTARRD